MSSTAFSMRSIADIKSWQQVQVAIMGGWLSTSWYSWGNKQQTEYFKTLKAQGFFNLKLEPTSEELCSDDHDWSPTQSVDNEDDDYSLLEGQQLRSSSRNWAHGESMLRYEGRWRGW
jgi:hypothetical protein